MGLDSRVRAQGWFGFKSRVWVFVGVFTLSYITNWGSGLVPVYVVKSGSGPVWVLDSWFWVFVEFLETRYITTVASCYSKVNAV